MPQWFFEGAEPTKSWVAEGVRKTKNKEKC